MQYMNVIVCKRRGTEKKNKIKNKQYKKMNGEMERIYTQLCGYYEKRLWMMLKGLNKKKYVICNW